MVDPLMTRHIEDLIEKLKSQLKLTSVVVTHDTRLARRVADRLMFLEGGQVVFFGRPEELDHCTDSFIREFLRQGEIQYVPG